MVLFFNINKSSIHLFNMNILTNKTIAERIDRFFFTALNFALSTKGFHIVELYSELPQRGGRSDWQTELYGIKVTK